MNIQNRVASGIVVISEDREAAGVGSRRRGGVLIDGATGAGEGRARLNSEGPDAAGVT